MFQYASLKGIARNRGYDFSIPPEQVFGQNDPLVKTSPLNIYNVFENISKNNIQISRNPILQERMHEFDEELFRSCPDNVDLFGYFQSPKYFLNIREEIIKDFIHKNSEVVIKPLGLMGGEGIKRLHHEDSDLLETLDLIDQKKEKMMIQKFIPEVFEGDKRVILISGKDCGFSVTRIPQGDDFRGNLAAGGKAEVRELNDRDLEIVNAIKPKLIEEGILVAGIDILGSFLTEINITSPTCLRELYDQQGINLAKDLIEQIEKAF